MTCAELAQLIAERAVVRSRQELDPVAYISRAIARVTVMQMSPAHMREAELIRFGHEFGLLAPELKEEN